MLLQGNVSSEELKQASQIDGKYLKFRNRLKPIAFASKSLSEAEQRYSNIERELLGVVWAIQHFNHLHGPFKSICRSGANPEKVLRIRGGAMQVYHHNQ